jgi:hypothetical protein
VILFRLLALPVTAPAAGIRYCLERVAEYADQQWNDEGPVRDQLLELHLELEEGQIGEDEFTERETALLARLREIRERKRELAQASAEEVPTEGEKRIVVIELPEELE